MRKRTNKRNGLGLAGKGIVTAAAAIMLTVHPGLSFPAWADEYNEYFDSEQRLIRTAGSYDDGTTSSSKYQYDKQGNVIYYSSVERDGSTKEDHYTYKNGVLVTEKNHECDADNKWEEMTVKEYGEGGFPIYRHYIVNYKGEIFINREEWNLDWLTPIRLVEIDSEGIRTQTDYTYNELGQKSIVHTSGSDGSYSQTDFQYDDSGRTSYYKTSAYDASSQTQKLSEVWYSGQEYGDTDYYVETIFYTDNTQERVERWKSPGDYKTNKCVKTHRDGSQDIEEYVYNSDGDEILYTKISSNGLNAKKVTNYNQTGSVSTYTDSDGNKIYASEVYDSESGLTTEEERHVYSDGSVNYIKEVYPDDSSYYTSIDHMIAADGTETYRETTRDSNDNWTATRKLDDGTVTVWRYDHKFNLISIEETMADGTTATTHTTEREDGKPLTATKRYSDGTEDRTEYQYDIHGKLIKQTDVRRNGVVEVSDYQYRNAEGQVSQLTVSFNNGLQLLENYTEMGDGSRQSTFTYNTGEVFQDMIFYRGEEAFEGKRIYSDGRVEELYADNSAENYTEQHEAWYKVISDYRKAFIEIARSTTPVKEE